MSCAGLGRRDRAPPGGCPIQPARAPVDGVRRQDEASTRRFGICGASSSLDQPVGERPLRHRVLAAAGGGGRGGTCDRPRLRLRLCHAAADPPVAMPKTQATAAPRAPAEGPPRPAWQFWGARIPQSPNHRIRASHWARQRSKRGPNQGLVESPTVEKKNRGAWGGALPRGPRPLATPAGARAVGVSRTRGGERGWARAGAQGFGPRD